MLEGESGERGERGRRGERMTIPFEASPVGGVGGRDICSIVCVRVFEST